MAALSLRELVLVRLAHQAARVFQSEVTTMHEKVAALHAQFESLNGAVVAAKAREASLVGLTERQAADLAAAQANAFGADTLDALDDLAGKFEAMRALLDGPAA